MNAPDRSMLHVGRCRLCETGPLGMRWCGGCGRVVVLCDECDAAWPDANVAQPPTLAGGDDSEALPCPHCDASLLEPPSRWATRDECLAEAWLAEALASGGLELSEGEPLGP